MPELPEVETVRLGLSPVLAGRRLTRVEARRPDLRFPLPDGFVRRLTGARIEALARRGKYILAPLDTGETLIVHLGMSGRFVVRPPGAAPLARADEPVHAHLAFSTDAGARLLFVDPRRFGSMDLVGSAGLTDDPRFAGLGPEPLGPGFDTRSLAAAFTGRRQAVKVVLLDQAVVAGLGNIYACEALHRARISPLATAGGISRAGLARLARAIPEVLREAIAAGGSTLRDFANAEGGAGYFQLNFRVYGRAGETCPRRGCPGVVTRIVQAGRSTFFCPRCQR